MFDGIEYRGYGQSIVEDLAHYASVPVWNGLTNEFHPTQILADFLTIREHFRPPQGHQLRLLRRRPLQHGQQPDGGLRQDGLNFTACAPKVPAGRAALVEQCKGHRRRDGCDHLLRGKTYTDVWCPRPRAHQRLAAYQINQNLMNIAGPKAVSCTACPPTTTDRQEMGVHGRRSLRRPQRSGPRTDAHHQGCHGGHLAITAKSSVLSVDQILQK